VATHEIPLERRTLHGHFSRDLKPILTIDSGDTIELVASSRAIRRPTPDTPSSGRSISGRSSASSGCRPTSPAVTDGMLQLMGREYGLERRDALAFASAVVDLRVTQLVNGVRGVHAVLAHDAIRFTA
jgi:acetamidase/formamidase